MPHTAPIQAPRWLTASQLEPAPAVEVGAWLFNEDSLTRRLTRLSANTFSVSPLQQGWQTLRSDECAALGVAEGSIGWVREVFLCGHGQPWVFARSVAARSALAEAQFDLESLGSRSLGELLFCDNRFVRGALQATRYPAQWLPQAVCEEGLWARRSCFRRDDLALLVAEIFLPAFWPSAAGTDLSATDL